MQRIAATGEEVTMERTYHRVHWDAVIGGWLVAAGIAYVLYTAGLAIGFTAFDATDAELTARGIGIGSVIWVVLTWVVSLFLGGMFASWFDGTSDNTSGTLHGIIVWGLAVTATGLMMALGAMQPLQSSANVKGAGPEAAAATDAVARYTAAAFWVLSASTLLGLIAAAAGGYLGSGHADRLYATHPKTQRERMPSERDRLPT